MKAKTIFITIILIIIIVALAFIGLALFDDDSSFLEQRAYKVSCVVNIEDSYLSQPNIKSHQCIFEDGCTNLFSISSFSILQNEGDVILTMPDVKTSKSYATNRLGGEDRVTLSACSNHLTGSILLTNEDQQTIDSVSVRGG